MRTLHLIGLAAVILVMAASISYAVPLHEDVSYWYVEGSEHLTKFNPDSAWLAEMIPTGRVLVKVQQTVYDQASTVDMLQRNGDGGVPNGFLYAYSVTNLNVGDPKDLSDMGITNFAANWTPAPLFVTKSNQTPSGWAVDTSPSKQPEWDWVDKTTPGILPGETVGGFWAVSNVGVDGEVNADAVHWGPNQAQTISGRTTGPYVPEPATFVSLFASIAGLGLIRKLRGK